MNGPDTMRAYLEGISDLIAQLRSFAVGLRQSRDDESASLVEEAADMLTSPLDARQVEGADSRLHELDLRRARQGQRDRHVELAAQLRQLVSTAAQEGYLVGWKGFSATAPVTRSGERTRVPRWSPRPLLENPMVARTAGRVIHQPSALPAVMASGHEAPRWRQDSGSGLEVAGPLLLVLLGGLAVAHLHDRGWK